jgi:hypothetical protein
LLSGCNEDSVANITFTLVPTHNGVPIDAGDVIEDVSGRNFSVSDFRLYITDMYLVKPGGERLPVTDLALVEWPGVTSDINLNIPKDAYSYLEFKIGLDPMTNGSDPGNFLPDHPLSDEQNMHLGDIGYVFVEIIGKVDDSAAGNGDPVADLTYRLGRNALYSAVRINRFLDIEGTIIFYSLEFEMSALFSGPNGTIDIGTDRVNTSTPADMPNAQIVMDNFVDALEAD